MLLSPAVDSIATDIPVDNIATDIPARTLVDTSKWSDI